MTTHHQLPSLKVTDTNSLQLTYKGTNSSDLRPQRVQQYINSK